MGTPVAATAWATAGDAVTCNPANGTCLIAGSQTVMSDGAVATIPITLGPTAGTDPVALSGLFAAAVIGGQGVMVNGMTVGVAYSIKVLSRCDLNSDGIVNAADVQLMIGDALGLSTCPTGYTCNLVAVVNEIIAATGGACKN